MNQHTWDPDNGLDLRMARQVFDRFRAKGYVARTEDGKLMPTFDGQAGNARFKRPPSRYEVLRGDDDADDDHELRR